VDENKTRHNEAVERINMERAEETEKLQAEMETMKETAGGLKTSLEEFAESNKDQIERLEKNHESHVATLEETTLLIHSLEAKTEKQDNNLDESNANILGVIQALKEEQAGSSKEILDNINAETGKVLSILSETKMELKTDQENILKVVSEDRELMENKTNQINQIIENFNVMIQEKLEENFNMMIHR
jgi:hypothetical protein